MAITTSTVNAPPSGTNTLLTATTTVGGNTGGAQLISLVDPDSASQRVAAITANGLKVDGSAVTQPISASALPLPSGAAKDGTDGTGITPPSGATGIRGWLSGIYKYMTAALLGGTNEDSVSVGGLNTTPLTVATLTSATSAAPYYLKTSAGRICRIASTDPKNAQTQTVYIINQASGASTAANILYAIDLGISEVVDLQFACSSGIGVYMSGAPTAPITFSWS